MDELDYVTRVCRSLQEVSADAWDGLLDSQSAPTPFMRHAYLAALHDSGSATPRTGWTAHYILLERQDELLAACVVYLKDHSYGEYVFDWAWASAYEQHGLPYYPKAVSAVPFTPVPGSRLLAKNDHARAKLIRNAIDWCSNQGVTSLHLLFAAEEDVAACEAQRLMLRHTVQFHWENAQPGFENFDAFLASLNQQKRKRIRQERRKVEEAGVRFRHTQGANITSEDWDFFYRCYAQTYREHGNPPYLSRDFFARMASTMPENWVLFVAERAGRPIASSLIAVGAYSTWGNSTNDYQKMKVAYGRYWGALERVDCLHFEACYYQPLQWCIAQGYNRFEGGAQGEHKMARALLPVKTTSAHWLAHPDFADAVARFLVREGQGIENYMSELQTRNPFKRINSGAGADVDAVDPI